MVPGGHVETDEDVAETACREVLEETGLSVRLVAAPSATPLPVSYPHRVVPAPCWIAEQPVPADNHTASPHVYIDHQYVAIADSIEAHRVAVHPFAWFDAEQVRRIPMFDDTRQLANVLFSCVDDVAAGRGEPVLSALAR